MMGNVYCTKKKENIQLKISKFVISHLNFKRRKICLEPRRKFLEGKSYGPIIIRIILIRPLISITAPRMFGDYCSTRVKMKNDSRSDSRWISRIEEASSCRPVCDSYTRIISSRQYEIGV